ncbi:MAG TPA: hypothetical protein VNX02_04460 [Steroidobacteraceae bacterium]|nr:hypothetical protein [Steroidobacteraceae bacterium]
MRGAATALAVLLALAAHAQTPPDTPPEPPAQAPAPATPPPADAAAGQAQPPPESPPPAETPAPSQPLETAPTPRASAPHATPHPQPAAPAAAADREGELQMLRAEVSRLQAELDAERAAAALPAVEESGTIPAPTRGAWEWGLAATLLALAAGFVLGWRVLDRRIRRKYGGLRIY